MKQPRFIPVSAPALGDTEKKYILDCLDTSWISSQGKYIEQFEEAFAHFCGTGHAAACSNGTAALHLALMALGIKPGDEVLVPTLTYIATANAVTYCGATPVFVDSEPLTWNIDPAAMEQKITSRTRAIIVVHLYGHPADMDAIQAIARRHGLAVIEDAAEAHGAEYKGRRAGCLSDLATFSFYGNKIITTGEGGMVVTNDRRLAERVRLLKGQGMDPQRRYWFPIVGYNYRMTNIAAAIGLAQMERVDWQLARRREVAQMYRARLSDVPSLEWQNEQPWARHAWWMFTVVLGGDSPISRDEVMAFCQARGIETRPVFYPMHVLPPYRRMTAGETFPVADRIARQGINLPTWSGLTAADIDAVCEAVVECIRPSSAVVARRGVSANRAAAAE